MIKLTLFDRFADSMTLVLEKEGIVKKVQQTNKSVRFHHVQANHYYSYTILEGWTNELNENFAGKEKMVIKENENAFLLVQEAEGYLLVNRFFYNEFDSYLGIKMNELHPNGLGVRFLKRNRTDFTIESLKLTQPYLLNLIVELPKFRLLHQTGALEIIEF